MKRILHQKRALEILTAAWRGGRVHHAWIFHGPFGVGKRTTAEAFAAALLDPDARLNEGGVVEADPGGETARLVESGTHPDLHVVTKEMALFSRDPKVRERKQIVIPAEVIREYLVEPASRSASKQSGARASKVFIVDEAERLGADGQNVMLKTLEEPPPGTVIILVTAHEDRLLPTIRSRCQRVAFTPLPREDMEAWMKREGVNVSGDERHWLLRFSQGSPGLARIALKHGFYGWYATLAPMLREIEAGRYPTSMGAAMAKMVEEFAEAEVKAGQNVSKDAANKAGARFLFTLLAEEVRHQLHAAVRNGEPVEPHALALEAIRTAERQLEANANMGLLLDNLAIQWAGARQGAA